MAEYLESFFSDSFWSSTLLRTVAVWSFWVPTSDLVGGCVSWCDRWPDKWTRLSTDNNLPQNEEWGSVMHKAWNKSPQNVSITMECGKEGTQPPAPHPLSGQRSAVQILQHMTLSRLRLLPHLRKTERQLVSITAGGGRVLCPTNLWPTGCCRRNPGCFLDTILNIKNKQQTKQ